MFLVMHNNPCEESMHNDSFPITFVHEMAGVISPGRCWVAFGNCRLFCADTLDDVLDEIYTRWNDERLLVG